MHDKSLGSRGRLYSGYGGSFQYGSYGMENVFLWEDLRDHIQMKSAPPPDD